MKGYFDNIDFVIKAAGVVIVVLFFLGMFLYRNSVESTVKNDAKTYLEKQLEAWKNGAHVPLSKVLPEGFDGSYSDWRALKLSDYFINKVDCDTKYVRKRWGYNRFFRYLEKFSYSNFYAIIEVDLSMEDRDGYPESYVIKYKLEPRGKGKFYISEYVPLF